MSGGGHIIRAAPLPKNLPQHGRGQRCGAPCFVHSPKPRADGSPADEGREFGGPPLGLT